MYCKKTTVPEIVASARSAQERAAEAVGDDAYAIYLYLQSYDAGDGHLHYGLHCDTSYGGEKAAQEAVDSCLPSDLFCIEVDDPHEAFAHALADDY